MKNICFVTAARSEYGLLKWLMYALQRADDFTLQLIVTGAHLIKEQGLTVNEIIEDGFHVDKEIDCKLDLSSSTSISLSMGELARNLPYAFEQLKPDCLVVLGDRYELLTICSTALLLGIPIAHICGGDVTQGAIDDKIRNAVTMMATYHFAGTVESANNIIRMRGNTDNIWVVGEPSIENILKNRNMSRIELASDLGLDINKKWVLYTCHPETNNTIDYSIKMVENSIKALLDQKDVQIIATYANADPGGQWINTYLAETAYVYNDKFIVKSSLGIQRYLSILKQVVLVVGNSSSGIVETPFFKTPTVNIGNRQKGRHMCSNIVSCGITYHEITDGIKQALNMKEIIEDHDYWGDGKTSERIVEILRRILL